MSVRDLILAASGVQTTTGVNAYSSGVLSNNNGSFAYTSITNTNADSATILAGVPSSNNFTELVGMFTGANSFVGYGLKADNTLWGIGYGTWGNFTQYGGIGYQQQFNRLGIPTETGNVSTFGITEKTVAVIKTDGTLWTWGQGVYGELASNSSGSTIYRSSPVQVGTGTNWSKVSRAAALHFIAVKTDGTLWAWGYNLNGELGDGTAVSRSSPVQIGTGTTWSSVFCAYRNSYAIKTDGTLWAWGANDLYGQVGDGTKVSRSSPVQIGTGTNWARGFAMREGVAAVKTDGTLWAWGRNGEGGLGIGNTIDKSSPTQVGTGTDWAYIYGDAYSANTANGGFFFTKTNGTLWVTGGSTLIQRFAVVGGGSTSSPVQCGSFTNWTKPVAGYIQAEYIIPKVGQNQSWAFINGSGNILVANKRAGALSSSSDENPMRSGGGLYIFNSGANNNITKLSLGYPSSAFIKTDGTLWTVGYNSNGVLGQNNDISRSSPVQVGSGANWADVTVLGNISESTSIIAVKTDGTLWSWGYNLNGELGQNDTVDRSSPVQIGTGTTWSKVYGHNACVHAIKTDGTLWAWGQNTSHGPLGDGTKVNKSSPVQIGVGTTWTYVAGIDRGIFALKSDNTLWAWGDNTSGKLGLGNTVSRSSPVQITGAWNKVASSGSNGFGIKTDGSLWGWGLGTNGGVGNNTAISRSSPVQIGALTTWTDVGGGSTQIGQAIKSDGTLWQWGDWQSTGIGPAVNVSSPVQVGTNAASSSTTTFTGFGHISGTVSRAAPVYKS